MYSLIQAIITFDNSRTMSLTPEQVQIVRSTVPVLQAHGNDITTVFYKTLLDEIPELHNIFNTANQANGLQPRALAGSLYAYASHIDDLGALSPAVEKICQKHASLYVRPEHYKIVGEYLLRAMGDVLGAALTKDVLNAWEAAYWQLANILISKENSIMEETNGWTDWRDFRIAKKIKESDEITSFYLEPVDGKKLPSYKPGQYISVMTTVPQLNYLQPRQYSLSDAPSPSHFRISIKRESGIPTSNPTAVVNPGYISNVLHDERQEGDILSVSHPAGDFFLDAEGADKDASSIVLISAGVGVTPMISILNSLLSQNNAQEKQRPRISFIHGSRNTSTQAFASHINSLSSQHPNLTSTTFLSSPDPARDAQGQHYQHAGRMDLNVLVAQRELCLGDDGARYFVCGPEGFMMDVKKWLVGKGVQEERVKMEVFGTGEIGGGSD